MIGEQFEKMGNPPKLEELSQEDEEMAENSSESADHESSESEMSEAAQKRFDQREKDINQDIKLMESLFQSEQHKSQRLLAVLTTHNSPVNCVRWNNLGSMFASADDEGTILLWEYRGLAAANAFQASLMGGYGQTYSNEEGKKAFEEAANEKERKPADIMEDWKTLKTWKGHHSRTISDLAWSPDNLHFASCSTDSTISIWHVNEHCKISKS